MSKFEFVNPEFNPQKASSDSHHRREDEASSTSTETKDAGSRILEFLRMIFKRKWIMAVATLLFLALISVPIYSKLFVPNEPTTTFMWMNESGSKVVTASAKQIKKNDKQKEKFEPSFTMVGSKADYKLNISMPVENQFSAKADITIQNKSGTSWNEIFFYFLPFMNSDSANGCYNAHLKMYYTICPEEVQKGKFEIQEVKMGDEAVKYILEKDILKLELKDVFRNEATTTVEVSYTFSLPDKGLQYSKEGDDFYLAQWYPMLPTFNENGWNIQPPLSGHITHFTTHSNFEVNYDIPPEYVLLSSADSDPIEGSTNGKITMTNVKEMYVALMKKPFLKEKQINDTTIRVFADETSQALMDLTMETASDAFSFFEEKIGDYPYKQLDIVIDGGVSMENPGVITVSRHEINHIRFKKEYFKHTIVNEIAHQWFYGVVNNEPYSENWLDEGIAEFSTYLYNLTVAKKSQYESFSLAAKDINDLSAYSKERTHPSNLTVPSYTDGGYDWYFKIQPLQHLLDISQKVEGDEDTALKFLSDYYKTYSFQQVTTKEFVKFTKDYFDISEMEFTEWLNLEETGSLKQ
ncbi:MULTISPECIES: M1 family aminopeptidase [unclassified Bacillus (in: firmicutes)]|uniref:M1 family aminopeptidase n=1 Tax=unclassified Bacillus (in: firmicutes) TaxID=185979 RepID=UPI0008E4BAB5|nr:MULTISPECIES: M1 family aminopeptidase [unclassified Bacillus (in: firmicutes)]SFB12053.1 Peptidase family M1 [Bacillus sp. UNCCL13]SFQ90348.1 Peptidase family M1 [Bacillus sp. cl95]